MRWWWVHIDPRDFQNLFFAQLRRCTDCISWYTVMLDLGKAEFPDTLEIFMVGKRNQPYANDMPMIFRMWGNWSNKFFVDVCVNDHGATKPYAMFWHYQAIKGIYSIMYRAKALAAIQILLPQRLRCGKHAWCVESRDSHAWCVSTSKSWYPLVTRHSNGNSLGMECLIRKTCIY